MAAGGFIFSSLHYGFLTQTQMYVLRTLGKDRQPVMAGNLKLFIKEKCYDKTEHWEKSECNILISSFQLVQL